MQPVKAFVGHSFSEGDKEVVRVFVDHFNNLAKAHVGGFTWDHAEEAEALPLSEKVLAKIQDKNVFIGICTRKELAVDPAKLKRTLLNDRSAKAADLQWKTSDWIIQEIGLAVGRNMSIIIFLEEGVRVPGGLYGNTEYVPFSRDRPHECFDKFLQMLVTLIPNQGTGPAAETKPAAGEEKEKAPDQTDLEPKPDWDADKYENAAFETILKGDESGLDKIDAAFKASILSQGDAGIIWESRVEYSRLLFGQKADFDKIKRLAEKNPSLSVVVYFAAAGYERFEDFSTAAAMYEKAATVAKDEATKAEFLGHAAYQYARLEKLLKVGLIIGDIKRLVAKDPGLEPALLSVLERIADLEKDAVFRLALMEHAVESHPTDTQKRFALAYKHSENENEDMALYHYLRIPGPQRDPTTWNNIGVSFGQFALPVKGIKAFRRAADAGETLAMSNLGNKLLNAGFFDDADAECKKALAIPDYHKNVATLLNRLKDVPEEEDKKLQETLEKAKAKVAFYRQVGTGVMLETPSVIASKWTASEGTLGAQLSNEALRLFGSYERPSSSLGGLLGGGPTAPNTTHRIEYSGRMRGRMFVGTVMRTRDGAHTSLLDGVPTKTLMYLSADGSVLSVMENYVSASPSFYVLRSAA
jgi:hypothetical protein